MAKLEKCNMEFFLNNVISKKIIAFGAGRKCVQFVSAYSLENKIEYIVDNDPNKQDDEIIVNNVSIEIMSLQKALKNLPDEEYIILITNLYSIAQIIEQLNTYKEFDNTSCYSVSLMQDQCDPEKIKYTHGNFLIPKMIHYCWFGHNPIPDKLLQCMESWKKFCPDYEIVRWDESNYDICKNSYISQAYKCQKWSMVSDFARLDIVGQYGGIYLDMDVEIIKSFDDLLADNSFWGFANYSIVNTGHGFGAVSGNEFLAQLRDDYNYRDFIKKDGSMDMRPCTDYQTAIFRKYGFVMNNKQQNIHGNVLYPMEVFNPNGMTGTSELLTANTHSIHRITGSWESAQNVQNYLECKEMLKNL